MSVHPEDVIPKQVANENIFHCFFLINLGPLLELMAIFFLAKQKFTDVPSPLTPALHRNEIHLVLSEKVGSDDGGSPG